MPNGLHDLGLAHGQAGVILYIANTIGLGHAGKADEDRLSCAARWLLEQDRPQASTHYGYYAGDDNQSRIGWCYGDLAVSVALAAAANALRDEDLRGRALSLARDCSARRPSRERVDDLGLCHGSLGVGLLFEHLAAVLDEPGCAEAAESWFTAAVYQLDAQDWQTDGEAFAGLGFLEGAVGMSAALLHRVGSDSPGWISPFVGYRPPSLPPAL